MPSSEYDGAVCTVPSNPAYFTAIEFATNDLVVGDIGLSVDALGVSVSVTMGVDMADLPEMP